MLLQDEALIGSSVEWITKRHYNAEWALSAQLEVLARHFDEMEDAYLRERKADLEQVVERLLKALTRGDGEAAQRIAEFPRIQGVFCLRIRVYRHARPQQILKGNCPILRSQGRGFHRR